MGYGVLVISEAGSRFPLILSLSTAEHLNVITLRASKLKCSPVLGFLPRRAAFPLTLNFPNPLMSTSSPFARVVLMISMRKSIKREDSNLEMTSLFSMDCLMCSLVRVMDRNSEKGRVFLRGALSDFWCRESSPLEVGFVKGDSMSRRQD
jgi:hypothetical protein